MNLVRSVRSINQSRDEYHHLIAPGLSINQFNNQPKKQSIDQTICQAFRPRQSFAPSVSPQSVCSTNNPTTVDDDGSIHFSADRSNIQTDSQSNNQTNYLTTTHSSTHPINRSISHPVSHRLKLSMHQSSNQTPSQTPASIPSVSRPYAFTQSPRSVGQTINQTITMSNDRTISPPIVQPSMILMRNEKLLNQTTNPPASQTNNPIKLAINRALTIDKENQSTN